MTDLLREIGARFRHSRLKFLIGFRFNFLIAIARELRFEFYGDDHEFRLGSFGQSADLRRGGLRQRILVLSVNTFELIETAPSRLEGKEFFQQPPLVVSLRLIKFGLVWSLAFGFLGIILHDAVGLDARSSDSRSQYDPFKTLASTEGNVDLSMCESGLSVDDCSFERQPLTLVNRDRPRQFEGILGKRSEYLLFYFFGGLVQAVFDVLPIDFLDGDLGVFIWATNVDDVIIIESSNLTNLAVEESFFRLHVVLDEHDLSPLLALEPVLGRKSRRRKVAADDRIKYFGSSR